MNLYNTKNKMDRLFGVLKLGVVPLEFHELYPCVAALPVGDVDRKDVAGQLAYSFSPVHWAEGYVYKDSRMAITVNTQPIPVSEALAELCQVPEWACSHCCARCLGGLACETCTMSRLGNSVMSLTEAIAPARLQQLLINIIVDMIGPSDLSPHSQVRRVTASFGTPAWLGAQGLLARAVGAARAWIARGRAALTNGAAPLVGAAPVTDLYRELFCLAASNPRARDFAHLSVAVAALEMPPPPTSARSQDLHCDEGELILRPRWGAPHTVAFTYLKWKKGFTRDEHVAELPGVGSARYTGDTRDLATWLVPRDAASIDWLCDRSAALRGTSQLTGKVWLVPFCKIDASLAHTLHACVEGNPLSYSLHRLGMQ